MSKGHKHEDSDESDHPLGWNNGKTLYVTGDDGTGDMNTELGSVDEMMKVAGISGRDAADTHAVGEVAQTQIENLDERIRNRLPDDAFLTDEGRLGAENNRSSQGTDYLNGKRRWVLKKMNDGNSPSEIYKNAEFTDSYIYRTRSVFGFLLEDDLLREVFIEDGGEYAPTHETDTEEMTPKELEKKNATRELGSKSEKEDESVSLEEAREMAEEAYQNGLEEARGESSESVDSEFDKDEWWDIMKTLLNNGEEDLARRITSEIL